MASTDDLIDSALVSADHSITGAAAWTDALLAVALFEVLGRSALLYARRERVRSTAPLARA